MSRLISCPTGSWGTGTAGGRGLRAGLSFLDPLPRRWTLSMEARDWGPEGSGRAYEDLSLILRSSGRTRWFFIGSFPTDGAKVLPENYHQG